MERDIEMTEKNLFQSCLPVENVQELLLTYLKDNNYEDLKDLLQEERVKINHIYEEHENFLYITKTALQIACIDFPHVSPKCIQLLLDNGADILCQNEIDEKNSLDYAAENKNYKILNLLLDHLVANGNDFYESNVIYNLIKYIYDTDSNETEFIEIIKLLLDHKIDINLPDDTSGWTVIYMAAKYNFKEIVRAIIDKKNGVLNYDNFENENNTARNLIKANKLYDGELLYYNEEKQEEILKRNVRQGKIDDFKVNYSNYKNLVKDRLGYELLYLGVDRNYPVVVKLLLDDGINYESPVTKLDRNNHPIYDIDNPFILACIRGYFRIVQIFMRKRPNCDILSQALIQLEKTIYRKQTTDQIDHKQCTNLLLKSNQFDINYKDPENENTALHYAARYQSREVTLKILEKGASLACHDKNGKLPIEDLDANTFELHLNNCIRYENKELSINDKTACINIDLTTLLPPRKYIIDENTTKLNVDQEQDHTIESKFDEILPETELLQYLCISPELKQLLKHPVILAFLYLKWYRIRLFFYINLFIYSLFIVSLITYITVSYNKINSNEILGGLSYVVLIVTFVLLVLREIFQIITLRLQYITFENGLEVLLFTVTALILILQSDIMIIRQLSAIAIVVSAIEFLLLVGQFPGMSTNIMMLRTVSFTFFKLLLWYSILLLAFAYSFFTLFQETDTPSAGNHTTEDEQDFFEDPGMSLLKTIVMLTGEFDAASIKFDTYPIISHLIFVAFVFLIAIVLFNLLNGLAVSDTQTIKNDAQLYGQLLRVEQIAHIERVLLRSCVIKLFPIVRQICLFPLHTTEAHILIYPNQNARVSLRSERNTDTGEQSCYKSCSKIYLDNKIQREIRTLLQVQKDRLEQRTQEMELLKKVTELEGTIQKLIKNTTHI